jgi:hypothetical protein
VVTEKKRKKAKIEMDFISPQEDTSGIYIKRDGYAIAEKRSRHEKNTTDTIGWMSLTWFMPLRRRPLNHVAAVDPTAIGYLRLSASLPHYFPLPT